MSAHHGFLPTCPLCEEKLLMAHSYLQSWFRTLKVKYPNVHVSWSYRGPEDQNRFFEEGRSRCKYPGSAHNKKNAQGVPCSLALDLFQIDEDGVARFSVPFYAKVAAEITAAKLPLIWGGAFQSQAAKRLGDMDHIQIDPKKEPA